MTKFLVFGADEDEEEAAIIDEEETTDEEEDEEEPVDEEPEPKKLATEICDFLALAFSIAANLVSTAETSIFLLSF